MKHIELFEAFWSSKLNINDNLKDNISDILLELEDDGFYIYIKNNPRCKDEIVIVIKKDINAEVASVYDRNSPFSFTYKDIENTIKRLSTYLKTKGYWLLNSSDHEPNLGIFILQYDKVPSKYLSRFMKE